MGLRVAFAHGCSLAVSWGFVASLTFTYSETSADYKTKEAVGKVYSIRNDSTNLSHY